MDTSECKKRVTTHCCVSQCSNYGRKGLSFHLFPTDGKSRKCWEAAFKMDKPSSRFMRVCSEHFNDSDYFPVSGIVKIRRLKKNVVPTKKLPVGQHDTQLTHEQQPRMRSRSNRAQKRNALPLPARHLPVATMEHGVNEHVNEPLHMEMTIKKEVEEAVPSTAYIDIEIDMNLIKEEPGWVQFENIEPVLLTKEKILEDSMQGTNERQGAPTTSTQAIVAADSTEQDKLFQIKEELENADLDIGPILLQPKDSHYGTNEIDLNCYRQENTILHLGPEEVVSRIDDGQVVRSQETDETIENSQKDVSYKCDKCLKICKSKETLVKHNQQLHGNESHRCTECNKEFKCKAYLQVHVNYAHSKQQTECDVCKKVYKSKRALTYHLKVVHSHKPAGSRAYIYTCDLCQKTFWRKPALRQHIEGVHGERIHQCQMCDKIYKCRHHLQQHITIAHGKAHHECEVCHKLFTARYILKAHIKKSHGLGKIQSTSNLRVQQVHNPRFTMGGMSAVVGARVYDPRSTMGGVSAVVGAGVYYPHFTMSGTSAAVGAGVHDPRSTMGDTSAAIGAEIHDPRSTMGDTSAAIGAEIHDQRSIMDGTSPVFGVNAQHHGVDAIKSEPADAELELGPVMFQHMDSNYRPYKEEPQYD